ncbi:hypothetical protein GOBAR_DD34905 [Gossypium barbadense]|nr:hypothetical protein GOBAR_DD34905 [Gossypium barbadense]
MAVAKAACLNHISRESSDIRRLANFYKEIFGFEEIESPDFGEFKDKGIQTFERSLPSGKVRQIFFFDPDGNGLEVASREAP